MEFGCDRFIKLDKKQIKLKAIEQKIIMIGYSTNHVGNACRMYITETKTMSILGTYSGQSGIELLCLQTEWLNLILKDWH